MTWSHNDMWMLTADHGGYVKYWQSNMNNVKMFQAHKEAIREARSIHNLPFSVVNPSLLIPLQWQGSACRGLSSVLSVLIYSSLCCSVFMSWIIDTCVLLQHCIYLSIVAYELCILIFYIRNYFVQKRCIFTLLNKVFPIIPILRWWHMQTRNKNECWKDHRGLKCLLKGFTDPLFWRGCGNLHDPRSHFTLVSHSGARAVLAIRVCAMLCQPRMILP